MNPERLSDFIQSTMINGVIGMNCRNRHIVEFLNTRSEIAVARDKIATKTRLHDASIPTAETIAVIKSSHQINPVIQSLVSLGHGIAVKPARSARGRGILLCQSVGQIGAIKFDGSLVPLQEFAFHLRHILHGEFSFGRPDDKVLIEQLLRTDSDWIMDDLPSPPDLRIIVYLGEVIMAMARLPTLASDGRANLHCGGIGVGIDLQKGLTRGGILNGRPIDVHPETGVQLAGHTVQDFGKCLEIARRCGKAFKLGFLGVDIMRDLKQGPVVLEVNARPGLGLQVANRRGLFQTD